MSTAYNTAYLIIDSGGGSTRIAIVRPTGEILDIRAVSNDFHWMIAPDGVRSVSFDPSSWIERIFAECRRLTESHPEVDITAVTATSAREGVVLIAPDGNAVVGLPNADRRGEHFREELQKDPRISSYIYQKTGKWCDALFSAFKIRTYMEESQFVPETFTSISEWIGYEFTGNVVIERSHACETLLYDTSEDVWSKDLCRLFSINPGILPEVVSAGTRIGTLTRDASARTGLPEGIPCIVTGADTQAAVKGISTGKDPLVLISGSTSPLVKKLSAPRTDSRERFWLDCDLAEGWLAETNTGASGINVQNYCQEYSVTQSLSEIDIANRDIALLRKVVSLGDKSFRNGKSVAKSEVRWAEEENFTHEDAIAAIWFDTAMGIAENAALLDEIFDCREPVITGCGGGLRSDTLCQWIADATGKTLAVPEFYEQASIHGCRVVMNEALGIRSEEPAILRKFVPQDESIVYENMEEWKALRSKIIQSVRV